MRRNAAARGFLVGCLRDPRSDTQVFVVVIFGTRLRHYSTARSPLPTSECRASAGLPRFFTVVSYEVGGTEFSGESTGAVPAGRLEDCNRELCAALLLSRETDFDGLRSELQAALREYVLRLRKLAADSLASKQPPQNRRKY